MSTANEYSYTFHDWQRFLVVKDIFYIYVHAILYFTGNIQLMFYSIHN